MSESLRVLLAEGLQKRWYHCWFRTEQFSVCSSNKEIICWIMLWQDQDMKNTTAHSMYCLKESTYLAIWFILKIDENSASFSWELANYFLESSCSHPSISSRKSSQEKWLTKFDFFGTVSAFWWGILLLNFLLLSSIHIILQEYLFYERLFYDFCKTFSPPMLVEVYFFCLLLLIMVMTRNAGTNC